MELQDELRLPAHKRRVGRIGSLHEFQQRALSYHHHEEEGHDANDTGDANGGNNVASPPPHTHIDILLRRSSVTTPSVDTDSDYCLFDQFRKPILHSQRSRSVGSLFGGARYQPKSFVEFYGRQIKVLSFLILLGVIGGPMGFGMRR